ncbi:MAG: hypothetical protein QOH66_2197 [Actinomycetota bacterium]|jgi:hypothetical protein|nr:hypothetical protein [Actinomycetota bacterium]
MEYRQLGRTGVRVSELWLGTVTFGREADEDTSRAIMDQFLAVGGTFVDTADGYGAHQACRRRSSGEPSQVGALTWSSRPRFGSRLARVATTAGCLAATSEWGQTLR